MRVNKPVTDREEPVRDDDRLISTTDLKGVIQSANEAFCRVAGFDENELRRKAHNIVRHPDMPEGVYQNFWDTLKSGRPWMGVIKNRCKNGDYYWVNGYVSPVYHQGEHVGYQSVRSRATPAQKVRAERLYARMRKGAPAVPWWARVGTRGRLAAMAIASALAGALAGGVAASRGAAVGSLAVAVVAVFAWGLAWFATRRLARASELAREVFDNPVGEYTYGGGHDVAAQVELALAMQRSQLDAMQTRMNDLSMPLQESAQATESAASEARSALDGQRGETEQVATAMNEMSATVQEVSRNTADAASSASAAVDEAGSGRAVIEKTGSAMSRLADEVEEAAGVVEQLKTDTEAIRKVLDVIQGISEQTNLLALNAAIEAARAGDTGRGFAVVAEEVRALSKRVSDSTGEIAEMIERLEGGVGQAATVMARSRDSATNVAQGAEEAQDAIRRTEERVREISDMNTRIASAAEQQSATAEEVNRSILGVNDGFATTDQAAQATSEASARLLTLVDEMRGLIRQFAVLGRS